MSQKVLEFYEFGGVDSRSNPLNMPSNRSLRCKNWVPMRSGHLQLRRGYTAVTQNSVTATPIHSLTSFRLLNDDRYLVYGQGATINRLDLSDGNVAAVTVKGSAIASSNRWSWAFAKNMLHGANGSQVKMVDANGIMRDNGLPDPTTPNPHRPLNPVHPDFGGVTVAVGAADANGVAASSVGGAQPGYQFYAALWNRVTNHVSNRVAIGTRVVPTVASGISITGLPDCSSAGGWDDEWDILIGRTDDGGEVPYPCMDSDGNWLYSPNASTHTGYAGATATIAQIWVTDDPRAHPHPTFLLLEFTGPNPFVSGQSVVLAGLTDYPALNGVTVVSAGPSTDPNQGMFWLPSQTFTQTSNWAAETGTATWYVGTPGSVTVNVATSDQNSEMPTRNSPPPQFDKIVRVGSRLMGVLPNSPFVYWTESETDAAQSQDYNFVGDAAECWPVNNVETMQTGANVNCIGQSNGAAFVFSIADVGILDELSGVMGWEGTWQCGAAGWDAFVDTPYGPYWLSGNKQLMSMSQSGPQPVSDEYEATLLARIGDAYLSQVQVRYFRDPQKVIDHIVIKAKDANGNVFRVIHDFTLKDSYLTYTYSSSPVGQGYEDEFGGALSSDFWMAAVRDGNDHPQLYAGAKNGQIYQLYNGYDDAGAAFSADLIGLLNAGEERPLVEYLEWFGDGSVLWSVGMTLDSASPAALTDLTPSLEAVPGGTHDYQYRVSVPFPEAKRVYVRAQLTSHAASGQDLNDPPHLPLETYGRVYLVMPNVKPGRGH